MTTVYDVPPGIRIERLKEQLEKEGKVKPPDWAAFARTGAHTEKAPVQKDWWYRRLAAVLRKVYLNGPVGATHLAAEFGGRPGDRGAPYPPPRRPPSNAPGGDAAARVPRVRLEDREEGPRDHAPGPQGPRPPRDGDPQRAREGQPRAHEVHGRRLRMADGDDELEAIRRRKLADLQTQQDQAIAQQQYREQVQAQRQAILRQILTPEARERLGRIELAYPELKESVEQQLVALAQSGRVQRMIDDETLRQILERVIPKKREIKIERR